MARKYKDCDIEALGVWPHWSENTFPPYWEELRRYVFRRDGYRCQRCKEHFWGADLDAHHMIPWQEGGSDNPRNLLTLCTPCHDWVHDPVDDSGDVIPILDVVPELKEGPEPESEQVCVGVLPEYPTVLVFRKKRKLPQGFEPVNREEALSEAIAAPQRTPHLAPRDKKWKKCRYFIRIPGNARRAACRRVSGPGYRDHGYNEYFDSRYWRKERGDWKYEKYSGEILWASATCSTCGLFQPKNGEK